MAHTSNEAGLSCIGVAQFHIVRTMAPVYGQQLAAGPFRREVRNAVTFQLVTVISKNVAIMHPPGIASPIRLPSV